MNRKILATVSILLVFAMTFALAGCDLMTEEPETTTVINVKTPLPTDITSTKDADGNIFTDTEYSPEALAENTKTIFEYFDLHINEVKGEKCAIEFGTNKSINNAVDEKGESIPMSDNDYVNAAITTLDSYMLHGDGNSTEFGEETKGLIPVKGEDYVSKLTLDEVESATCVDNGTERIITVTLKSPAQLETIVKAYEIEDLDAIMAEFEKANGYMSVEKPTITYKDCQIIIKANVETDEVTSIEYIKTMDVKTAVTGEGKLESIGTVPVIFNYRTSVWYNIDRTDPATATTLAER